MSKYISDEDLKIMHRVIKQRFKEINLCMSKGAYFATILLIASCAECLLYFMAVKHANTNPKNWSFEALINWALSYKIISLTSKRHLNKIKNLRNLIHIKLDLGESEEINLEKTRELLTYFEFVIDEIWIFSKLTTEVANASN